MGYFHIQYIQILCCCCCLFKQVYLWNRTLASSCSKMYPCLLICTFLRRTTEYAIETTDNLPLSYNEKWLLPLFFHNKLFSYRRFTFKFVSAGQIFQETYTYSVKPIWCLTTRWPKQLHIYLFKMSSP